MYVFCATESDVDYVVIVPMEHTKFFKSFEDHMKKQANIQYINVSDIIYLFIVCQKSSMWQSHVSKHEAGQWD